MPCTMSAWEVAIEEARINKAELGFDGSNARVMAEVACDATSTLIRLGLLHEASQLTQKWGRRHERQDQARQRDERQRQQERNEADEQEFERLKRKLGK